MPKLTSWHPTQKSWFLGIGIDQYSNFTDLANAVKGVSDVKNLLIDKYDIDQECALTLFNSGATKENIIDTLDDLGSKIKPGDKLMIYYSGHGHLNDDLGIGYWIPSDAKKEKASSYLPNSTIRDYIKAIKAKHILLVSDSCFSGSLFMQGAFRTSRAVAELDSLSSRWALCSGRHDEKVYDGHPGENSPFTQSFIDLLTKNTKNNINVARLADHVIEQTAANYEQLPDGRPMFGVGHQGGQYIFWKKGAALPISKKTQASIVNQQPVTIKKPPITAGSTYNKKLIIGIGTAVVLLASIAFFLKNKAPVDADLPQIQSTSEESGTPKAQASPESNLVINNTPKKSTSNTLPTSPKSAPLLITNIDDAVIELFELQNHKGRKFTLYGGNSSTINNFEDVVIEGLKFEDVISSVTLSIPSDYEFVLYEKRRQKGESITLSGNGEKQAFPNIGSLLGKISSCELRKKK